MNDMRRRSRLRASPLKADHFCGKLLFRLMEIRFITPAIAFLEKENE